ncbi:MAG: hypothetical protein H6741_34470 [Alphaproteobacteria bacterium]|nr:hypothetical protein [Alphaproteobacteria bacterium]
MQISQSPDATTLLCARGLLHRQDAPTDPMGARHAGWTVPPPTAEDLAWNERGAPEDPYDVPTEQIDRAELRRMMADDPWFHTRVAPGWEPQVRVRSRLESAAQAALLLIAAWLPVAAFLMAG